MKKRVVFILLLLVGTVVFAQDEEDLFKEFKTLIQQFRKDSVTPVKAKILATDYLAKTQKTGDKRFIGRGYYLLAIKNDDFTEKIQYLDSAIYHTKDLTGDDKFPMIPYLAKGTALTYDKNYKKALDTYFLAEKAAEERGYIRYKYLTKYSIAYLKRISGDFEEAEKLFKEYISYLESSKPRRVQGELQALFQLSSLYYESKNTEKAAEINKQGILIAKKNDFSRLYYSFVTNEGINLHIQKKYKTSIDSIQKGIPHLEERNQLVGIFYLAKNYFELGNKKKAIAYFKKIDTSYVKNQDLFPPLRESYVYLINNARAEKNDQKELYYTKQLLKIDSTIHADYKYLSKNISKKYDIPAYVASKERLIKKLQGQNQKIVQERDWIVIIGAILGVITISFLVYYYRLKKQYERRYNELMEQSNFNASIEEEITIKNAKSDVVSLGIGPEIIKEVLQSLEGFEQGEAFLINQISLKDVAKIVNTNSKYLSKIVNSYKEKNFTTYINDLRIDYLVKHVQTDTKYQKYTIRAIAEEIGFSNPEGFSRAFQKKTGLKPSYFIKKVRENAEKKQ
ncbi:MAG: helix-turn-helix domain-containing protein [Bacteroidota bacterium]